MAIAAHVQAMATCFEITDLGSNGSLDNPGSHSANSALHVRVAFFTDIIPRDTASGPIHLDFRVVIKATSSFLTVKCRDSSRRPLRQTLIFSRPRLLDNRQLLSSPEQSPA